MEQLHYGEYVIAKEPHPARPRAFRAVVMTAGSNRIVFRSYRQNWTRASRQECRDFIERNAA